MKKKIFSNWGLKLVSLLLAFGLWMLVMYIEDPPETVRFTNVPVTLLNTNILTNSGKVYEVLEETDIIRSVTVKASKSVTDQITFADIKATADFNDLTVINTVEIKISIPSQYIYTDIICSNEIVKLNVEDKAEKDINIVVETVGEVAEGYELESAVPSQNRIHISGPVSKVSQVSYARVDVNINDINATSKTKESIRLYDAEDNPVDERSIIKNIDTVDVSANVFATKTVPVNYNTAGMPTDGYLETGIVEVTPRTVTIAGPQHVLNEISEIIIPEELLDISGQSNNFTRVIDITDNITEYLPNGARLAHNDFNGRITITVYIEPVVTRTLSIPRNNIQIINIPEGFEADITDEAEFYEMEVRGLEAQLSQLQGEQMQGTVDMGAWMEEMGREPAPLTYFIAANFDMAEDIVVSRRIEVRILLSRAEEE